MSLNSLDVETSNPASPELKQSSDDEGPYFEFLYSEDVVPTRGIIEKLPEHVNILMPKFVGSTKSPSHNDLFSADWSYLCQQESCCTDELEDSTEHASVFNAFGTRPLMIVDVCRYLIQKKFDHLMFGYLCDKGSEFNDCGVWYDGPNDILKRHDRAISFVKQLNPQCSIDDGLSGSELPMLDARDLERLIQVNGELFNPPYCIKNQIIESINPMLNYRSFYEPVLAVTHHFEDYFMRDRALIRVYQPYLLLSKIDDQVVARIKEYFHVNFIDVVDGGKKRKRWDNRDVEEFLWKIAKAIPLSSRDKDRGVFGSEEIAMPVLALPVQVVYLNEKEIGGTNIVNERMIVDMLITLPKYRWHEEAIFLAANNVIFHWPHIFSEIYNFPKRLGFGNLK